VRHQAPSCRRHTVDKRRDSHEPRLGRSRHRRR
jgi:hypothetical protein